MDIAKHAAPQKQTHGVAKPLRGQCNTIIACEAVDVLDQPTRPYLESIKKPVTWTGSKVAVHKG
jgi:hypothetical protein